MTAITAISHRDIDKAFAKKIANKNSVIDSLKNIRDHRYFYPEVYQASAKFVYDINNMTLEELQDIFPSLKSKYRYNIQLNSIKLKYIDYLQENYCIIIDTNHDVVFEPEINIFVYAENIVATIAPIITNFKTDLLTEETINLNNLTDKFSAFFTHIRNEIDRIYSCNNNTIKSIEKWNATIKKIDKFLKICNEPSPIDLKPKFNNNDDFYLLFPYNTNNVLYSTDSFSVSYRGTSTKVEPFKGANNIGDVKLKLKDLIKNNEQLNFIKQDAKNKGYNYLIKDYHNLIDDWVVLLQYEPEMYQQLAKWCYKLLANNNAVFSLSRSYRDIIFRNWQVAKISYEDYIKGNYKLIVEYNLGEKINYKSNYVYNIKCKKEVIDPITIKLNQAMQHLEIFLTKKVYDSLEDDYNYKINILKPLFLPINAEDDLLTIQDFCLSVNLLIGDIYQDASNSFDFNKKQQNINQETK